jgi:hypothetical protein
MRLIEIKTLDSYNQFISYPVKLISLIPAPISDQAQEQKHIIYNFCDYQKKHRCFPQEEKCCCFYFFY